MTSKEVTEVRQENRVTAITSTGARRLLTAHIKSTTRELITLESMV